MRRARAAILAAACCATAAAPARAAQPLAVVGADRGTGYRLTVAERSAGTWRWRALATVGTDADAWTGYQCLTGDGRWVLAVVAPARLANDPAGRDRGATAYVVSTRTGRIAALREGVALKYHVTGCGEHRATVTRSLGSDQAVTEVLDIDLRHARVARRIRLAGQVTSVVPVSRRRFAGVAGGSVVAFDDRGRIDRRDAWAPAGARPYELRPSGGGVDALTLRGQGSVRLVHVPLRAGVGARLLGTGRAPVAGLFLGAHGRNVAVGLHGRSRAVRFAAAPAGARALGAARDGSAVVTEAATASAARAGRPIVAPRLLSARTGARLPVRPARGRVSVPRATAAVNTTTPKCAVPRNDLRRQVPQPNAKQVVWAIEQAVRGNLKGSVLTRPANFLNMGLAAYQPSSDFSPGTLHGIAGRIVPPSIVEATYAQESNFKQASWHALPGVSGNPLIADYYGDAGTLTRIDYDQADCGYGISQLTDGMAAADTALSANGKTKVAVDYAENITAGLQVLVSKWNQLYDAGVTLNDADPMYLQNWYFALWAYNTGFHPNTGSGPWGLGWTNNPQNADYPPDRQPFLRTTYADAAHPADWPYQERVLGFSETPLLDYRGHPSYAKPTAQIQLPDHGAFCTAADECSPTYHDPANPGLDYCRRADRQCWWHGHVDYAVCADSCATSLYTTTNATTEPAPDDTYAPQCASELAPTAVIVDEQPSNLNVEGCAGVNWSSQGTFTVTHGQDAAGTPIGAIDWHQLGTGFGGHVYFTHNRAANDTAHIETGTWTPPALSAGLYDVQAHVPVNGATADSATYRIDDGNGAHQDVTINQHVNANRWVELGSFNLQPGAKVTLSSVNTEPPGTEDIAYDALSFTFIRTPRPADDHLAERFEPVFRFDSSERWRPLSLSSFVAETDASGTPLHRTCMPYDSPDAETELGTDQPPAQPGPYDKTETVVLPDGTVSTSVVANCPPLTTVDGITRFRSTDAYLDLNGLGDGDTDVYTSPDTRCQAGSLQDCNGNEIPGDGRSAVYYYITETSGYAYIQYWLFYRFNTFSDTPSIDHHEGDWEAVAVAPSANGATFDFASFSQHKYWYSYLRQNLRCYDQQTLSCGTESGKQGIRIDDYVAAGSHANYPMECVGSCLQGDGLTPENTHDGVYVWGHAFDDAGLLPAPSLAAASWFNWAGHWGTTGDPDGKGSPASPAEHHAPSFQQPWERCATGNDACARPSRAAGRASVAVAAPHECGTWFGTSVAAALCSQAGLERALRAKALGPVRRRLSVHARGRGYASASARGVSQAVGAPLRRGDSVTVAGPLASGELAVHVAGGRALYAHVPSLRRGRRVRYAVVGGRLARR